ncbi:MAG: hypothetical protein KBT68_07605 [bacterium]|nr:hypothetical protein [Candidatus Colisoma equi]
MSKKSIIITILVLLALCAALAGLNVLRSEKPAGDEDLITGDEFQSEELKLKDPDPSKEDFKSIGDIRFEDKAGKRLQKSAK